MSEKENPTMNDHLLISTFIDQTLTLPAGGIPPREPGYVFGTVHHARPHIWDKLHRDLDLLIGGLRLRSIEVMPAYAVGALRSFIEPLAYTFAMDHAQAIETARILRHDYLLQRSKTSMHLIDVHAGITVADVPYQSPESTGVCVMPNNEPGEICVMSGSPYGSREISASLDWKWERMRLIAALGCSTCDQGKHFRMRTHAHEREVFSNGGPIALVPREVPTRYTVQVDVSFS